MLKLLFSKILFFTLFSLVFSSSLQASAIKVSDFKISYGIDEKNNKPIHVSKSIDSQTKQIYASAWVHNIFPLTQFNIKWYYYSNAKKKILYQYKIKLDGTQFIYSAISIPADSSLPEGEYFVDIISMGKVIASTSFHIVSAQAKKPISTSECLKPTKADNKIFIADGIELYPSVKSELSSMNLRRFHDAKERFSLLAPSGWKALKKLPPNVLLQLSASNDSHVTEFILRELPIGASLGKKEKPELIVMATTKLLTDEAVKNDVKNAMEPKLHAFPGLIVSNFMFIHTDKSIKLMELHSLIYDGKYMYDAVLLTDKKGFDVSKFLSTLASYSFWTKESCR